MDNAKPSRVELAKNILVLSALTGLLGLSLLMIWRLWPENPVSAAAVSLEGKVHNVGGAPSIGQRESPVALVEFTDFQCHFCNKFASEVLPELRRRYVESGQLLFVFRQFPITDLHPAAAEAGAAAICANEQGRFWQMHDSLFQQPRANGDWAFSERVRAIGLNADAFATCMKGVGPIAVRADLRVGDSIGIAGTPKFLVGRLSTDGSMTSIRRITGARSINTFTDAIDQLLR